MLALKPSQLLCAGFIKTVVPVSSCRAAEAAKMLENIFRRVNIALVNELKIVYRAMGIDIWEVIEAAKTKPFGFMPFYPGPGLGGHCIPDRSVLSDLEGARIRRSPRASSNWPARSTPPCRNMSIARLADELDRRFSKGLNGSPYPGARHRLQEERRRHARKPDAQTDGAARGSRRARRLLRPLHS